MFDFTNSSTYELAKYLASVLKLHEKLVNHGIKTTEFKNNIDTIHLKENEMMASFNISSIFTTVTISPNFEFLVPVWSFCGYLVFVILFTIHDIFIPLRSLQAERCSNGFTTSSDCRQFTHAFFRNQCDNRLRKFTKNLVTVGKWGLYRH